MKRTAFFSSANLLHLHISNLFNLRWGGIFICLLFTFGVHAQIQKKLLCNQIGVEICPVSEANLPISCQECATEPTNCHRVQYQVRLVANVPSGFPSNFALDYKQLNFAIGITQLPLTAINIGASHSCSPLYQDNISFTATEGIFAAGLAGPLEVLPIIEFTNYRSNMFTIVVDGVPGDIVDASCITFLYISSDMSVICNTASYCSPVGTTAQLEFPQVTDVMSDYTLDLGEPIIGVGYHDIPVTLKITGTMSNQAISFMDFQLESMSSNALPLPDFQINNTYAGYFKPVQILPSSASENHKIYVRADDLQNLPPNQEIEIGVLRVSCPVFLSLGANISIALKSPRIVSNGCYKPNVTNNPRAITCSGVDPCAPGKVRLEVYGMQGQGTDCQLRVLAGINVLDGNLHTPANSNDFFLKELKLKLKFNVSGNTQIKPIVGGNDIGCGSYNCLMQGGGSCFVIDVSNNIFEICFSDVAGHVVTTNPAYFEFFFNAPDGCILSVDVIEAKVNIGDTMTVSILNTCVPEVLITGFPYCPTKITGKIFDTAPGNGCVCGPEVSLINETLSCSGTTILEDNPDCMYGLCICGDDNYTITPLYDVDYLNGVSTLDLLLINRHILGQELLNSPYKMIAADANVSGTITTFDIVELRKLILGIITDLPDNTSWRFLDKSFIFPDPLEPFSVQFPEEINTLVTSGQPNPSVLDFWGIKVGDVNYSHVLNCDGMRPEKPTLTASLSIPTHSVKQGEYITVPVMSAGKKAMIGLQAAFRFDPIKLQLVQPSEGALEGFSINNFGLTHAENGEIRVSWISTNESSIFIQDKNIVFYLTFKALEDIADISKIILLDPTIMDCFAIGTDLTLYNLDNIESVDSRDVVKQPMVTNHLIGSVSPNPTTGGIEVTVKPVGDESIQLAIYGPFGRRLFYKEITTTGNSAVITVSETAQWPSGIYTWRVTQGKNYISDKFIKQ